MTFGELRLERGATACMFAGFSRLGDGIPQNLK